MPEVGELLTRIRSLGDPVNVAGMARFGINTSAAYGVSVAKLRAIAKEVGRDHALACGLWAGGIHEGRMLAAHVADPAAFTPASMDRWARDFDSWDICDNCCIHLFRKTPFAWDRAVYWSAADAEFVKRAGFVLMATLAVHDCHAGDERFRALLPLIEQQASDSRNLVKKAVNWALRQIGKRNRRLHRDALRTARRLAAGPKPSARWIGNDARRELESEAVRKRLRA